MNLFEFIRESRKRGDASDSAFFFGSHRHVNEPGFDTLYVRFGKRRIQKKTYLTLDLASLQARHPGEGRFTKLFQRLRKNQPDLALYVECVQNPRFAAKLLRMGFIRAEADSREGGPYDVGSPSFFMPPVRIRVGVSLGSRP